MREDVLEIAVAGVADDPDVHEWVSDCSAANARTRAAIPTPLRPTSASCCARGACSRSEEHTSELQSRLHLVCRLLLEKKKKKRLRASITRSQTSTRNIPPPGGFLQASDDRTACVAHAKCIIRHPEQTTSHASEPLPPV